MVIEAGVKVVETAGSSPKKWITLFKSHGIVTIHKCVTIRHALTAERLGVDMVSLDGFECAGHPGEADVGNFVLQAKGAKMLKVPYLCSGGVGDGRQLAAALALGAEGVNCGIKKWTLRLILGQLSPPRFLMLLTAISVRQERASAPHRSACGQTRSSSAWSTRLKKTLFSCFGAFITQLGSSRTKLLQRWRQLSEPRVTTSSSTT